MYLDTSDIAFIVVIVAVIIYFLVKHFQEEEKRKFEREKQLEEEKQREIARIKAQAEEKEQKRNFENTVSKLVSEHQRKYKNYTLEQILYFLSEYTTVNIYKNDLPEDELLKKIDFAIKCDKSVKHIEKVIADNGIEWNESREIHSWFYEYIPLSKFDTEKTLDIIDTVLNRIKEREMSDVLETRLIDIYHKHFSVERGYYSSKSYKYGYFSQWDILHKMSSYIPIKTLFEMSDEEIIPVMDEILSEK